VGVGIDTLIDGMVGAARIRMRGELWEPVGPEERGARVYVTPVRGGNRATLESSDAWSANVGGPIVDLVAWHPIRPGRWALREGAAPILGHVQAPSAGERR